MQTNFTPKQLKNPRLAEIDKILRRCVHCGFCIATCPTYVLLGDERDSPRGRIYLMKEMFEHDRRASPEVQRHVDRCLSCLSCMTTCPSGVDYMHLVDHARAHIEETGKRGFRERMARALIAATLPYPDRFRLALQGRALRPAVRRTAAPAGLQGAGGDARAGSGRAVAQRQFCRPGHRRDQEPSACGASSCSPAAPSRCCGPRSTTPPSACWRAAASTWRWRRAPAAAGRSLHHMGREADAIAMAKRNIDAWTRVIDKGDPVDAVIVNASGCGTTVKDYGHLLAREPKYAERAAKIAGMARDVTEFIGSYDLGPPKRWSSLRVAYHSACSMQHGQRIIDEPRKLLRNAGFTVVEVPEGHLCCGSAGSYNILQPAIAADLRDRKVDNIKSVRPDLVATGNIGCLTQLASGMDIPIAHTVELLDWAYGGPMPRGLEALAKHVKDVPEAKPLFAVT